MFRKKRKLGYYHATFVKSHQTAPLTFWFKILNRLLALAVIGGIVYFFLFSSFFNIKDIQIEGVKSVNEQLIRERINYHSNIFFYPTTKTAQIIKNTDPAIKETRIHRGLPNSLKIEVLEYQPELVWIRNSSQGLVSDEGVFFNYIQDKTQFEKLPEVREQVEGELSLGETVAPPSFVEFVKDVKNSFTQMDSLTFNNLELGTSSFNVVIKTKENIDVFMSADEDLNRQISYLEKVIQNRRDRVTKKIDVRVPRWSYVE